MKKLIIIMILSSLNSCTSQTKKENTPKKEVLKISKKDTTKHKTHTMEYFNIKEYENLKKDTEFGNSEGNIQYILDDNKRIRISYYYDKSVSVEESSKTTPFRTIKGFSQKTKILQLEGYYFYDLMFGLWKNYNEQGKLIKETNYDLPYKFSIEDLEQKMLKEYNVDIMNVKKIYTIIRFVIHEHNNTPFYEVYVKTGNPNETDQYVIHGTTGEILFTDTEYRDEKGNSPYERYLNKEAREENLFKRYNGKDYTEEEWEAFEKTNEYKTQYKKAKKEWDKKSFWDKLSGN